MSAHEAWSLACRLFSGGRPVFQGALSAQEIRACATLGPAIRRTVIHRSFTLCPYCQLHSGQMYSDGRGGQVCECPDCGTVELADQDRAAVMLDEGWLRSKLRLALGIESRDGIDDLGDGVWRLGDARRSPVLLARSLVRLWSEPALLDRVRVAHGELRVITPKPRQTRGSPFGPGVQWLALEDRFALYGSGISCIGGEGMQGSAEPPDLARPVHGPFSADFRYVSLLGEEDRPIRCTLGQAKVFEALWSFKGEPVTAQRVMQRAGLNSDKPIDVFKVKARDKGKPEAERPLQAYRALVTTQQREGLYSMACARAGSL